MGTCILCGGTVQPGDGHVVLRDGVVHRTCDVPLPGGRARVTEAERAAARARAPEPHS